MKLLKFNFLNPCKLKIIITVLLFSFFGLAAQELEVNGTVTDVDGNPIPGVNIVEKSTQRGTITNLDGKYKIKVSSPNSVLIFSFVGYIKEEVNVNGRTIVDMVLVENIQELEGVVVVGYGVQKKSDITGTVASLPEERLDMIPNADVTQAIQGAIPGVSISTNAAGASPDNTSIMIRGRNSIAANNSPLIILDGIPYEGNLSDISPNDIKSIEVLKDASAAAIYGSRGSNGVILITTKMGKEGESKFRYDGYYSIQKLTNFPDLLNGEEFYQFKLERDSSKITLAEQEIYENDEGVNWADLALREGRSHKHNMSYSGGTDKIKYYISGNYLDVEGIAINDNYTRISSRVNLDINVTDWLKIGTKSTLGYADRSGYSPSFWDITWMSPLTKSHNEDGSLTIYPYADNPYFSNPLQSVLVENEDKSYQSVFNSYLILDIPFIKGLQYQLNVGLRRKFTDNSTYWGRDTKTGLENQGVADLDNARYANTTLENILNYDRSFGKNNLFLTFVYSFEEDKGQTESIYAQGFPHDVLTYYSIREANLIEPSLGYSQTNLISQMGRINYGYDDRYLLTLTTRRDGYSGFGSETKWGIFPSLGLGWNIANESFFPFPDRINVLKLRASWGENGNQALGAYETISRLGRENFVSGSQTMPGYTPTKLGEDNLGWESTETYNVGLDFSIFANRIYGDINIYQSNTYDLLLRRSISPIHGITSITQNIGETENRGFEFSLNSVNINRDSFTWSTNLNYSSVNNKITSLYAILDDEGNEIDDIGNRWFIGEPINVNFDWEVIGVWQEDEEEEAALYGTQPGFVKIKDQNNDTIIDDEDRIILGQRDPQFSWGMTNTFKYKGFTLSVFVHGVHGVTKVNPLKVDNVWNDIVRNTTDKNWWTPENPTNEFYMNHVDAAYQGGAVATYYEDASFIRLKDLTLAYDLPTKMLDKIGISKLRMYFTGRNLLTITKYEGMDPELDSQRSIPLQKEFIVGVNFGF
jgi:TonB-linked SusC/RagA family outer membrane protein